MLQGALAIVAVMATGGALTAAEAEEPAAVAAPAPAADPTLPRFEPTPSAVIPAIEAAPIAPPAPEVAEHVGSGVASWYGRQFAGRRTASGETFDPTDLTAAHRTLPFGSRVRVTHEGSGRSVIVRINDRGPYGHGRIIDVSEGAAKELGLVRAGSGRVKLELLRS